MGVMDFVIAVLATWQGVEVWHHSALFASCRARVELWDDKFPWGFARDVLRCPFCLSVWMAFAVVLMLLADPQFGRWLLLVWFSPDNLGLQIVSTVVSLVVWTARLFVHGIAISRAANLCNDFSHKFNRTPGNGLSWPQEESSNEES